MARAQRPRLLKLSGYSRKTSTIALWFLIFAGGSFLFWDRQALIHQHEADVAKLLEEKARLLEEVQALENENASVKKGHVTLDGLNDAPADSDPIARERRDKVRAAMIHAWSSYEKYAWGFDELQPQSRKGIDQFGGLGATIVDSLDTLFIMGLHDEYVKAAEWVSTNLNFNRHYSASVFETSIRVLGGLVSAYDLSGNTLFISKAQDLADRLLPAWNTPTGIPMTTIDLASGSTSNPHWTGGSSVLADLGTEQVEMISLSQRTGVPKYGEKAEKVILKLREVFPSDGLLPIYINPHTGQPTNQKITMGAMGDSFYEYLLKVWILGNKTDVVQHYRDMWEQSMEGLISLVKKSNPSSYVYLAERNGNSFYDKMDELACFAPGMLALGSDGASPEKASQYLEIADGLAFTCYNFYMSTRTHLAGENYLFRDGQDMVVGEAYNILRPETIESLFYLWRKTGNAKYREWAWDIFQAFESYSRISSGYVGLRNVNSGEKDNMMQSFFLSETLKYLYLLFSPSSVIPLDEWVFNTEAHPIRIVTRLRDAEGNELQSYQKKQKPNGRTSLPNRVMRQGSRGKLGPFDYS